MTTSLEVTYVSDRSLLEWTALNILRSLLYSTRYYFQF